MPGGAGDCDLRRFALLTALFMTSIAGRLDRKTLLLSLTVLLLAAAMLAVLASRARFQVLNS